MLLVAISVTPVGGFTLMIETDLVSVMPHRFASYAVARRMVEPLGPAVNVIELPVVALVIVAREACHN